MQHLSFDLSESADGVLTLEAMAGRLLDLYRSLGGASSQQV